MAVDVLKSRGVPEERILFLNLIASPEGVTSFAKKFPKLRVVTAFIDQVSNYTFLKFQKLIDLAGSR
jgi:uracil phosphoribosyltransferase